MNAKTRLLWLLATTWLAISPLRAAQQAPGAPSAKTMGPHDGRTSIAPEIAQRAGITTAAARPGTLERTLTTFGNLAPAPGQRAEVRARFPGLVTRVLVNLGDQVGRGNVLAQVESNDSLQTYPLRAPIAGVVTARHINSGEVPGEAPLFVITNLDTLWADLRIFPGQRAAVATGQAVSVTAEGIERQGTIQHLLPTGEHTPWTLARVEVENSDGLLMPGLLVAGKIVVETVEVPLAVHNRALQSFRDGTVVFIQKGDTYETRPLELGRSDGEMTEVLSGLEPGDRYVVDNSYLIKADIEKSGASHDH
ncbi:efflux RND transporter periplasmic adaptor subunit [Haliea atlantica]